MTFHDRRFPNESPQYREARNNLLQAEIDLRAAVERVAAQRRALPPGGAVPQDYVFAGANGTVRLSDLFTGADRPLLVYGFMFAPDDADPCPMCNAFLDGLDGNLPHLRRQADIAIVAKAPIDTLTAWADSRGWRHLRLYSSGDTSFNKDYHAENEAGDQLPTLNVFCRRDGAIRHTWSSELMFCPGLDGGDPRHVDLMWPLWNLLDLTPQGRGDWYPAVRYG